MKPASGVFLTNTAFQLRFSTFFSDEKNLTPGRFQLGRYGPGWPITGCRPAGRTHRYDIRRLPASRAPAVRPARDQQQRPYPAAGLGAPSAHGPRRLRKQLLLRRQLLPAHRHDFARRLRCAPRQRHLRRERRARLHAQRRARHRRHPLRRVRARHPGQHLHHRTFRCLAPPGRRGQPQHRKHSGPAFSEPGRG